MASTNKSSVTSGADITQILGVNQSKGWYRPYLKWVGIIVAIAVLVIIILQWYGNNHWVRIF